MKNFRFTLILNTTLDIFCFINDYSSWEAVIVNTCIAAILIPTLIGLFNGIKDICIKRELVSED